MAGFYIHIPFCRKVCYYCDFHFVANLKNKEQLLHTIEKEIVERAPEWQNHHFDTIYFGGGTPSVLSIREINGLLRIIKDNYTVSNAPEVTFEANPDDLSAEYLDGLISQTIVNRLSIGIQSIKDDILRFLNRRHNGNEAINSVNRAKTAGFRNISIDLIYGIPGLSMIDWESCLNWFLQMEISHLAAYHLTIEPKTVFGVWQRKNKIKSIPENISIEQYQMLIQLLRENNFIHYEISNFAREGSCSIHNSNYWKNVPYIGVGPSAHSFNNQTRRWNVANNSKYIELLQSGNSYSETETLSENDKFNDYLLTSLRSRWGVQFDFVESNFGIRYAEHLRKIISATNPAYITLTNNGFGLNEQGWFLSDLIIQNFFYLD